MVLSEKKTAIEKKKCLELVKETELKHPALLQYLDKRRISRTVAARYLKQIHFKHPDKDKAYFGLGFPSENGFEARNEFFKSFVGSVKTISKILTGSSQSLYLFEGFMDFLTFLTMHGIGRFEESVIVMNSAAFKAAVLEEITLGNFQNIHLYLDKDAIGETLTEYFEEHLPSDKAVDHSGEYKGYKDLNKWFTSQED